MKLVHVSDLHHDAVTLGVRRAPEVENAVGQAVKAAIDGKVDMFAFTGDLCDPEDGPALLRATCFIIEIARELSRANVHFMAVAGNHDVVADGTGTTTLAPLIHLRDSRIHAYQVSTVVVMAGVQFLMLPYRQVYRGSEMTFEDLDERGVCLTHLQFQGAQLGEESLEMSRGRDHAFPWEAVPPGWLILAGHYHRRQIIEGPGGRRAYVVGSPIRNTFGEGSNETAYTIVEL